MKDEGMKRLADLIHSDPILAGPLWVGASRERFETVTKALRREMLSAPVIVVDNVAEYVYAGTDQEFWSTTDFPNVRPPYSSFFLEWRRPSRVISRETGTFMAPQNLPRIVGAYFTDLGSDLYSIKARGLELGWNLVDIPAKLIREDSRLLFGALIVKLEDGRLCHIGSSGMWVVSPAGEIQGDPLWCAITTSAREVFSDQVRPLGGLYTPFLLAISFMHCKNVEIARQDPPTKLSRVHQKRHGKPLVRYHVLNIEPMKRVLEKEGRISETGLKRALHICRGHFATYRDRMFSRKLESPVTVWRPMHVRGAVDEGVVVKDYNIAPPASPGRSEK